MIFRFTPVILFFFFGALLSVSLFLLSTSYRNAQEALQFEQLDQISKTHQIAQQYLNFRLKEGVQSIQSLSDHAEGEAAIVLRPATLKNTLFDYIVRFEKASTGGYVIREIFGDIGKGNSKLNERYDRWFLEEYKGSLSLVYQFRTLFRKADGRLGERLFKAGINLDNNFSLLNAMRTASRAYAHRIIFNNKTIVSSTALQEGVEDVAQEAFHTFAPVFADFSKTFSADVLPLRVSNGTDGLYLLTVATTQGTENWRDSFNQTVLYGLLSILAIAISVTYILRILTHQSLSRLLEYAQGVRENTQDVRYVPGTILEFNEVGRVIERMVHELSDKRKYIEDVMEAATSPIIAWDTDGEITVLNKATQKIFNLKSRWEITNIAEFLFRFRDDVVKAACHDALKGLATKSLETKFRSKGRTRYVIWSIAPLRGIDNKIYGVIAQGQDITERRRAEGNLRLSSTVFENTAEGIMITDKSATIVDVNTAFSEITGYAREEVIGQNPRIMKSGRHPQEFYDQMWTDLAEKGYWRGEVWDRRKNGEEFPKWLSINACRNETGQLTHYVAVFSDITAKKEDEHKLEQLAHFDHLTGLPNRVLFHDRLNSALARSRRDKEHMSILFVDLDRFKQINDSLGHRVGDLLLKEVSKRLLHSIREIDTVARLSGDEFTVILTDIASMEDVEMIASRIVKSLGAPYFFEGHELFVSASVGISMYPTDGETSADLLRNADVAMYHAKEKGRNNYQFFDPIMNEKAQSQLSLANKLRIALNRKQIHPHYQLKIDTMSGHPVGLEALARWNDERGQPIPPGKFIPIAEEHGLIAKVGHSILHQVCTQIRMWRDMDIEFGNVAVNLSAQQFRDPNLLSDIKEAIEDNRISPTCLEVEITENMVMDDVNDAIRIMKNLKEMGLTIAIDDFGTGYSSLSYLKRFPVDTLKIDRSFIRELTPDSSDAAIVSSIVSLAERLGISVVAEGVEQPYQVEFLRSIGCNIVQGFLFAKPCPGGEVPLAWNNVIESNASNIDINVTKL